MEEPWVHLGLCPGPRSRVLRRSRRLDTGGTDEQPTDGPIEGHDEAKPPAVIAAASSDAKRVARASRAP